MGHLCKTALKNYSTCSSSGDCNGGAICVGDGISTLTSIGFDGVHFYNNQNDGSSGSGGAVYVNVATTVTFDKCEFFRSSDEEATHSYHHVADNGNDDTRNLQAVACGDEIGLTNGSSSQHLRMQNVQQ